MNFAHYLKCRHPRGLQPDGPSFRIAKGWVAVDPQWEKMPSSRAQRAARSRGTPTFAFLFAFALLHASAQTTSQADPQTPTPQPGSTVVFSRDATAAPDSHPQSLAPAAASLAPGDPDPLHVTEAERSALIFTAYDLDLHLSPASAGLSARAALTVRNDSTAPLSRLILQLSSTLHWDAISLRASAAATPTPAHFTSRLVDTDADHTGSMSEAIVTLPQPLASGASLSLIALYSGTIPQSANRLIRIGAPGPQALAQDWDQIAPTDPNADTFAGTALRGFGNVLWYPISAPAVFLGDGAKLFDLVGRTKLRESAATLRLRLAIEYAGEPPDAAYFCGRRGQLAAISDNADLPATDAPGIATVTFDAQPIGFRTPSLFITASAAHLTGPPDNGDLIAAITGRDSILATYASAAAEIAPMLGGWLGAQPDGPLTILDHPGDPYEDDALLVASMSAQSMSSDSLTLPLVHSLTHAWIHSSHPWIDEGLPAFMALLWTERSKGRTAAIAQLAELDRPLALAEPDLSNPAHEPSLAGASLADASGEIFYRNKAAAVWWMLRSIVGDDALKAALQTYREDSRLDRQSDGFEKTVEAVTRTDLRWFFRDWVYTDRGLPDLRIANVTPSHLEPNGAAAAGWLVAVEVRNDGFAEAEVPVIVRSADAKETRPLRVPARGSASVRIVFAGRPDQVQVNDGSVPETESSTHIRDIVLPAK